MNHLTLFAVPINIWETLPRDRSLKSLADEALRAEGQVSGRISVVTSTQQLSDIATIIAEKTALLAKTERSITSRELSPSMVQDILSYYELAQERMTANIIETMPQFDPKLDVGRMFCPPSEDMAEQQIALSQLMMHHCTPQQQSVVETRMNFYSDACRRDCAVVEFLY